MVQAAVPAAALAALGVMGDGQRMVGVGMGMGVGVGGGCG